MARHCPACGHNIPIHRFGGLVVRHEPTPASGWFRCAPQRLFCPACGVEVHSKWRPLAYWVCAAMLLLFVVAMLATVGVLPLGSWGAYRGDLGEFWILACIPLVLAQARWGTNLVSAPDHDEAAPPP